MGWFSFSSLCFWGLFSVYLISLKPFRPICIGKVWKAPRHPRFSRRLFQFYRIPSSLRGIFFSFLPKLGRRLATVCITGGVRSYEREFWLAYAEYKHSSVLEKNYFRSSKREIWTNRSRQIFRRLRSVSRKKRVLFFSYFCGAKITSRYGGFWLRRYVYARLVRVARNAIHHSNGKRPLFEGDMVLDWWECKEHIIWYLIFSKENDTAKMSGRKNLDCTGLPGNCCNRSIFVKSSRHRAS